MMARGMARERPRGMTREMARAEPMASTSHKVPGRPAKLARLARAVHQAVIALPLMLQRPQAARAQSPNGLERPNRQQALAVRQARLLHGSRSYKAMPRHSAACANP